MWPNLLNVKAGSSRTVLLRSTRRFLHRLGAEQGYARKDYRFSCQKQQRHQGITVVMHSIDNKSASKSIKFIAIALIFSITTASFAQDSKSKVDNDDSKTRVEKENVALELKKMKAAQSLKVNVIESKLRADAAQLNINLKGMSEMRANIRESLRAKVAVDRTVLTDGRIALINTQIAASLPTAESLYFAQYEMAQMKNQQGRLRLKKGAFQNLNKQYVRESMELERLNLLEEWLRDGDTVTMEMLPRPKLGFNSKEQDEIVEKSKDHDENSNDSRKPVADKQRQSKIMFGTPKAGDFVTPKTKIIYLLRNEADADSLLKSPSNYNLRRLVGLCENMLAAKFEPTQKAEVLIEGEQLLKLRIDDKDSEYNNFIGWVSKSVVVRYRNTTDQE
jgi:hypothetical protein